MDSVLMEKTLFCTSEVQLNKSFVLIVLSSFFCCCYHLDHVSELCGHSHIVEPLIFLFRFHIYVNTGAGILKCDTSHMAKSHDPESDSPGRCSWTDSNHMISCEYSPWKKKSCHLNSVSANSYFTSKVLIISDSFQICFCSFCTLSSKTRNPHSQTLTKSFR